MSGIGTPPRVSPSPKRAAKRGCTPPRPRDSAAEERAQHPFPPSPLTPVGWDVDLAKAAGTVHPSAKKVAPPRANREGSHSPDNPNKVARMEIRKEKRQGARTHFNWWGRGGAGRGRGRGGRGTNKAQAAQPAQQEAAKVNPSRTVKFTIPGTGARGGGKGRGK